MTEPDPIKEAVQDGLDAWHRDSERMRAYWDRMHDHWWTRSWARVTSSVGKWLLMGIFSGAFGAILVYAVKAGWIK